MARTSCDWSTMSWRSVSRVRKKFALMRKFAETIGMPSVSPAQAALPMQEKLTGRLLSPDGQAPGGLASPCAPAGSGETQDSVGLAHTGTVCPPSVVVVLPLLQNERSPCLAASMATVTR